MIEGFMAFEGMIRGQDLTVHTDHLNRLSCAAQQVSIEEGEGLTLGCS